MPNMRSVDAESVVAVVCADIHLSAKAPAARSQEPDWYAAMARPLDEVNGLAHKYDVPVICAGDVFDKWNVPPELISFAMRHLPDQFFTIAGQHDLPFHGLDDIHRSGLGVLRQCERVEMLTSTCLNVGLQMDVYGFGWNQPIVEPYRPAKLKVAVVHAYCWMKGMSYAGAPDEAHVKSFAEKLQEYDVAIFGDNHSPFERKIGNCLIYNCGGFMRRKSDDLFRPSVGLLHRDGSIVRHYLSDEHEVFTPREDYLTAEIADEGVMDFVASLRNESADALDFFELLQQASSQQPPSVQKWIKEVVDAHRK